MQTIIISSKNKESRDFFVSENYKLSEVDGNSIVLKSLEGKKISITQTRELIKFASLRPHNSTTKFALIDDAQFLTIEAQNSLLKLIEEPPVFLQIILSVDDPKNLIDTILSRCILIYTEKVPISKVKDEVLVLCDEFYELINMSVGERFDWFSSNQSKFKDRQFAIEVLLSWEMFLRNFMVSSVGAKSIVSNRFDLNVMSNVSKKLSPLVWQYNLRFLSDVLNKIRFNNANIFLGVESFLINFPVFSR